MTQVGGMSEENSDKLEIGGNMGRNCIAMEGDNGGNSVGMVATFALT